MFDRAKLLLTLIRTGAVLGLSGPFQCSGTVEEYTKRPIKFTHSTDDESATTTTTSATTTPTTGARPSAVATATTHKSEESLKVKQQPQQHDYSTTIYKTTFTENIIIKNYDGPDSGNLNVSEASQTLSVLGEACTCL